MGFWEEKVDPGAFSSQKTTLKTPFSLFFHIPTSVFYTLLRVKKRGTGEERITKKGGYIKTDPIFGRKEWVGEVFDPFWVQFRVYPPKMERDTQKDDLENHFL